MALFLEDKKELAKKQITIPQNAKKIFKALKNVYEPYLDKPIKGAKILKSLASDKTYNSKNDKLNGKETKQTTVSFDDAKKRLQRQDSLNPNSIEYQLYGGELAHNILKKGIESARGVKKVDKVQPPKPTAQMATKPSETSTKEIQKPNGKITYTESKQIVKENYDEHVFYEYLDEYDVSYVFDSFLENPHGKQNWGVLINPTMYAKALKEFTKFGTLTNSTFPSKYVYQWMGIIMRNTAILRANTEIAGHSSHFPYDEFEDFLYSYFGNDRNIESDINGNVKIEITPREVITICDGENPLIKEDAVDKYGQTYFPWITQSDANRLSAKSDIERMEAKYGEIGKHIEIYNQKNRRKKIEIDYKNSKFYWCMSEFELLDEIGMYDWMQMPDGSDAWSDFGIDPLLKIFREYNEELPPSKVLVLVNRALDVYHQRGDMASIFIQGGSSSLSRIAEDIKREKGKKVYITEKQINKLWQIQ